MRLGSREGCGGNCCQGTEKRRQKAGTEAQGGRMETLWGLVRHAGGNVVIGPNLIVGALCLTIRSCWKSRDHRANVDRVCATFESNGGGLHGFDLASALVALHRPGSNGSS